MTSGFPSGSKNFCKFLCFSWEVFCFARIRLDPLGGRVLHNDCISVIVSRFTNFHWELCDLLLSSHQNFCSRYGSANASSARCSCNFGPLTDLAISVFLGTTDRSETPEHARMTQQRRNEPSSRKKQRSRGGRKQHSDFTANQTHREVARTHRVDPQTHRIGHRNLRPHRPRQLQTTIATIPEWTVQLSTEAPLNTHPSSWETSQIQTWGDRRDQKLHTKQHSPTRVGEDALQILRVSTSRTNPYRRLQLWWSNHPGAPSWKETTQSRRRREAHDVENLFSARVPKSSAEVRKVFIHDIKEVEVVRQQEQ